jgi:hypothetical protein
VQAQETLGALKARSTLCAQGLAVLRQLGADARNRLKACIEPIASQGLREIFGDDATFEIRYKQLPKAGFAAEVVTGVGEQRGNPMATDGNSMSEIVSDGILRPLVLCLHRGGGSRVCILDEPYAGVDAEHLRALFSLLKGMGEDLNAQFIIVTHAPGELDDSVDNIVRLDALQEETVVL